MAEFVDVLPGQPYEGRRGFYAGAAERNRDLMEHAAELKANPMRWSPYPRRLTASSAERAAQSIRDGCSRAYHPDLGFEAVSRVGVCYVRYNPEAVSGTRAAFYEGYTKGRHDTMAEVRAIVWKMREAMAAVDGWDSDPRTSAPRRTKEDSDDLPT